MYDITIIGTGSSALFFLVELLQTQRDKRILVLEKGNTFPAEQSAISFGGLLNSEAKFNFGLDFGGTLSTYLGPSQCLQLMQKLEAYIHEFVGDHPQYETTTPSDEAIPHIHFIKNKTSHLGRTRSAQLVRALYESILPHVTFVSDTQITTITKQQHLFMLATTTASYETKELVLATNDSTIFNTLQFPHPFTPRDVLNLGVRVEFPADYIAPILGTNQELKMRDAHSLYSYCFNHRGRIVPRKHAPYVYADGQNHAEFTHQSGFSNFALLQPLTLPTHTDTHRYLRQLSSHLSLDHGIAVQSLTAFQGEYDPFAQQSVIIASNPAIASQRQLLNLLLPQEVYEPISSFLHHLQQWMGSPFPQNTQVYGIDYRMTQELYGLTTHFHTVVKHLYVIGDLSGQTASLSQAAISGMHLAQNLSSHQ